MYRVFLSTAVILGIASPVVADSSRETMLRMRALYYATAQPADKDDIDVMEVVRKQAMDIASQEPTPVKTVDLEFFPKITPELIEQTENVYDLLLDPVTLKALSRMPVDQANEMLAMIKTKGDRIEREKQSQSSKPILAQPVDRYDIPSMSDALGGAEPVIRISTEEISDAPSSPLDEWTLVRVKGGRPALMIPNVKSSVIEISEGMVLGHLGQVKQIIDDGETFEVRMDTGQILSSSS